MNKLKCTLLFFVHVIKHFQMQEGKQYLTVVAIELSFCICTGSWVLQFQTGHSKNLGFVCVYVNALL